MVGALEVGSSVGDPVSMQWQQLSFALPIFPPKLPYVGQPASDLSWIGKCIT